MAGVFSPLAGNTVVTATDPGEHIRTVLTGLQGKAIGGVTYASPMPPFAAQLTDEEIAAPSAAGPAHGHHAPGTAQLQAP